MNTLTYLKQQLKEIKKERKQAVKSKHYSQAMDGDTIISFLEKHINLLEHECKGKV